MRSAEEALEDLKKGNQRFVADLGNNALEVGAVRRYWLVPRQEPFAVIVGCSDSRVPAEIVFDQGLGDLFVIRVAGNIVTPSQIGSVEFAVEKFGTPLVVVLGHSGCGAIEATLDQLETAAAIPSPNLEAIVERIRPAVQHLLAAVPARSPADLVEAAVRANIRASVEQLRDNSPILEKLIDAKRLLVVGAEYSLETGRVEFFEGEA